MVPMREIETPNSETPGPRPESRPRVSGTLTLIDETLAGTRPETPAAGPETPAETPAPAESPSPESRVSAQVTAETPAGTPAHPARPAKVIRRTVARPVKSRPGSRKAGDPGTGTAVVIPRSIRWAAGPALGVLTLLVGVMAGVGQMLFAVAQGAVNIIKVHSVDLTPWFAPFVFDAAMVALFALGMSAVYRRRSPWLCWHSAFAIGAFSIFTNTQHEGALFFAGASVVLMIVWFCKLHGQYVDVLIAQNRRSDARSGLPLWLTAPRTWLRSEIITSRKAKPIASAAQKMLAAGEETSERDLAILLADRWLIIRDDVYAVETKNVSVWNRVARRTARRKAKLTAWREIDQRLGLPVVELDGIELAEVRYAAPPPPAPVAEVTTPAPAAAPQQQPAAPRPPRDGTDLIKRTVRFTATAPQSPAPGKVAIDIDKVPGLPRIPADNTDLRERVIKDIGYIVTIINHSDYDKGRWHSREEKIQQPDIKTATGMTGKGVQQRLMTLMNDLRALPMASNTTA